jgi:hypothetical protein
MRANDGRARCRDATLTILPPFALSHVLKQLNASPRLALNVLCRTYLTFPARNDHTGVRRFIEGVSCRIRWGNPLLEIAIDVPLKTREEPGHPKSYSSFVSLFIHLLYHFPFPDQRSYAWILEDGMTSTTDKVQQVISDHQHGTFGAPRQ